MAVLDRHFIDILTNNKKASRKVGWIYKSTGDIKKGERVLNCCAEPQITEEGKFWRTFFCGDKFCPICQWKKSRFVFHHLCEVMREEERSGHKFISFNLTVKNVPAEELKDTINRMNYALKKMCVDKTAFIGQRIKGFIRSTEITYQSKDKTFHPHFHIVASVDKEYFKRDSNQYITTEVLAEYWRKAYDPNSEHAIAYMEGVTKSKKYGNRSIEDACAEITKYIFKVQEHISRIDGPVRLKNGRVLEQLSEEEVINSFNTIKQAMFGRPSYRFFGTFRKVEKKIKEEEALERLGTDFHFIQLGRVLSPSEAVSQKKKLHRFTYDSKYRYLDSIFVDLVSHRIYNGYDPFAHYYFNTKQNEETG